MLEKALEMRQKYAPGSDIEAETHEKIASVARAQGDMTQAQASLQQALQIRKQLCNNDENHESVVAVIAELSDVIDESW